MDELSELIRRMEAAKWSEYGEANELKRKALVALRAVQAELLLNDRIELSVRKALLREVNAAIRGAQ